MIRLNKLLTATDLSAPAEHAVDRGFQIAASTGAGYSVVHALELDALDVLRGWIDSDSTDIKRNIEDEARDELLNLLTDPKRNRGVIAEGLILAGSPLATISAQADTVDADLLILGMHGNNVLRQVLLGSTASRLLRKTSRRPVLVVKRPPHEPYRRLLIPVDFSPVSAKTIRFARLIAPDADIVLLHAFELPFEGKLAFAGVEEDVIQFYQTAARKEAMQRLRQLADEADLPLGDYTPLVVHGSPSQQVLAQEDELEPDLIVMGKHGLNVTEELLLGSVTKNVLSESKSDVLIVIA